MLTSINGKIIAQNNEAEKTIYSIPGVSRNQLESIANGGQEVQSILPLIEKLSNQDPDRGALLVEELLLSDRVKKYSKEWAILQYYKTIYTLHHFRSHEELELLKENIEQCITVFNQDKMPIWQARSYSMLSDINFHHSFNNKDSLFTEATTANDRALELVLGKENKFHKYYSILGEIYRVKGNICLQKKGCRSDSVMTDYNIALEYFSLNEDKTGQSKVLINKAITLAKLEKEKSENETIESPIGYYERAIAISNLHNDQFNARLEYAIYLQDLYHSNFDPIWNDLSNLQLISIIKMTNGRKAEAYFQLAVNNQSLLSYTADDISDDAYNLLLDTVVHYYQSTLKASMHENNINVYNEVFDRLALACPHFPEPKCSELLIIANEVKGYFLKKNKSINTEITKRNEQFRIAIESQKRKGMWRNFVILSLIGLFIFFYIVYRQKLKNLKSTLAIKQEALRAQMNPHFISNTINAIESLVNQGRNDEASEYLIDFSRLCRLVINNSRESSISLKAEIEALKYFLSLEKLRISDDLEYAISIDDQLSSESIMVPPLILQPFIENAIWHGIKNKPDPKNGELKIEVNKLSESTIECIIEDNGVGRERAKALQEASVVDQKSWGTALTQERIKYLEKNKNASLEIIDLYDKENKARGTMVKIILPI